jgi:membrane-associated PAP2 superfamily phosphatase
VTPTTRSWLDRTLWPAVALLGVCLWYFQVSDADLAIQDHLFDFEKGRWLVDKEAWWPTFWFHKLPKYLIIAFGVFLLLRVYVAPRWRKWPWFRPAPLAPVWVVILCLAITPIVVAILKANTHVFCPWDVDRYGGKEIYLKTWTKYDETNRPAKCGNCWPAGHASGGFALVAVASLAVTRRGRVMGTLAGLTVGSIMGIYQMVKGAHYLSDTLVTMLLAWIIHLLLRRLLLRKGLDDTRHINEN